jgi:ABC-type Fe3+ transport system substrate-binding protein
MRWIAALLLTVLPATAQEAVAEFGTGATRFVLRSTTDIPIIEPVIERFAELNPDLKVHYEQWGSNALFANSKAACAGGVEPADAVLSSAVQQMVWLVNAACSHTYKSPATAALAPTRRWRDEIWGITSEPAVIVYNKSLVAAADVPRSRFALLDAMRTRPEFLRGKIATYDIVESGLGYLFAYSDSLEATTFGAMLEGFERVDAVATCCSAEIINGVAEGQYLIAYNVLGSYVATAQTAEIGVILPEDYTLFLSRAYMIPRQAREADAAERFLEFLLSPSAQEILARTGLVSVVEPAETGLRPSARRIIPLSPALLVALDEHRRASLFGLWDGAFLQDSER